MYDKQTLLKAFKILDIFQNILGLIINLEKTKRIDVGGLRASRMKLEGELNKCWTTKLNSLGIAFDIECLNTIAEDNI